MKLRNNQSGFVEVLVLFAILVGSAMGFTGAKAHENYMDKHPEKAQECLSTDISTANSTCKLSK